MNAYQVVKISLVLFANILIYSSADENFGLCGDPHCTVLLGEGEANRNYVPAHSQGVNLRAGDHVQIYVRNLGPKKEYIGIKFKGRKALIHHSVIVERRTIRKATIPAIVNFIDGSSKSHASHSSSSSQLDINHAPHSSEILKDTLKEPFTSPSFESFNSGTNQGESIEFNVAPTPHPSASHSKLPIESSHSIADSTTWQKAISDALDSVADFYSSKSKSFHENTQMPTLKSEESYYTAPSSSIQSSIPDTLSSISPQDTTSQVPNVEHQEQSNQEDISLSIMDIRKDVLTSMAQKQVEKAVDVLTSYHTTETKATNPVDDDDDDEELQKTLKQMEQQGANITEILNDQKSFYSGISNKEYFHTSHNQLKDAQATESSFDGAATTTTVSPPLVFSTSSQVIDDKKADDSVFPQTPSQHDRNLENEHQQKKQDFELKKENIEQKNEDIHLQKVDIEQKKADELKNEDNELNNENYEQKKEDIEQKKADELKNENNELRNENYEQKNENYELRNEAIEQKSEGIEQNEDIEQTNENYEQTKEDTEQKKVDEPKNKDDELKLDGDKLKIEENDIKNELSKSDENNDFEVFDKIPIAEAFQNFADPISNIDESHANNPSKDIETETNDLESTQDTKEALIDAPKIDPFITTETHSSFDKDENLDEEAEPEASYQSSVEEESKDFENGQEQSDSNSDNVVNAEGTHLTTQRQILQNDPQDVTEISSPSTNFYDNEDTTLNPDDISSPEAPDVEPTQESLKSEESSSSYVYDFFGNGISLLRSFLDNLIIMLPEPFLLYMDASKISARAVVFTSIMAFPCALLFVSIFFLKERSKEERLIERLREAEHQLYLSSSERDILREETKTLKDQLISYDTNLAEEKSFSASVEKQLQDLEVFNKDVSCKHLESVDVIKELEDKITAYSAELKNLKLTLHDLQKENSHLAEKHLEQQETISTMAEEMEKLKSDTSELEEEKDATDKLYSEREKQYQENIMHLQESCSQLLQEADQWNNRVKELTGQLSSESAMYKDLQKSSEEKDLEIESLKKAFTNLEVFQNLKEEGDIENLEEKMKIFMDVSSLQNDLEKNENLNKCLNDRLQQEKKKVLDLEVQLMESKSCLDKMKIDYDQAVQLRVEAQSKLNFLTEHFEAKESQLQKKLGILEVMNQQKEENSSSAEKRIHLIEKENESCKYQLETMKQEMENTERNLKNQIATQEKKAHENWLAARAAERKLDEAKQESATLRQRLTLLEREQENWMNSSQNDVVKPVAQRISDMHDMSGSHEGSISSEFLPRHLPDDMPLPLRPPSHSLLPPGPMMPPPPPPPPPPHFFPPPFNPMMNPPPPRQHWRMYPDKHFDSDRRITPSDFDAPLPRRFHPQYYEGDRGSASPGESNSRSRGSTPPPLLPDFHNIPPPVQRHPDFIPPPPHPSMHRTYKGPPPRLSNHAMGTNGSRHSNESESRRHHPNEDV